MEMVWGWRREGAVRGENGVDSPGGDGVGMGLRKVGEVVARVRRSVFEGV